MKSPLKRFGRLLTAAFSVVAIWSLGSLWIGTQPQAFAVPAGGDPIIPISGSGGSYLLSYFDVATAFEPSNGGYGGPGHSGGTGDADVGAGTNLGASTITANYDGRTKHRTTIGSGVRSSVHVSFVAPVTVGDEAVTGAGSVINEDVPAGALGIARARQTNKPGYAAQRDAEPPERGTVA